MEKLKAALENTDNKREEKKNIYFEIREQKKI